MATDGAYLAGACVVVLALVVTILAYRYREGRGDALAEQIARERQLNNEA
jgi:Tfp pilus assembly protein PilN